MTGDITARYFIGVDRSNRTYIVPVAMHDAFFEWAYLGSDDPRYSEFPNYVTELDRGDKTLTFSDPRQEKI